VACRPNDLLRTAREAAGLTQEQLAELANTQVEAATDRPGAMDADYIGKLERGIHTWPNKHYRQALRSVLGRQKDAELGFFSTRSRPTTVARSPRQADGGDDVERKAFLRVLAGSVAGLAFSDPLNDFVTRAATGGQARIGQAEVDQVRHLARMFATQDHLMGSGLSSQAVVTQLDISADLLDGQFAHEAVREQLFAAVADLADVAGGMCFDAGSHAQAERCFRFAVGCATEAADWSIRAKALSGLANLAVHQGRPDDALSFSEMALVRADRLTPLVRSVMHTRHARALGLNGGHREADCITAVRQAEDYFSRQNGDEPDWLTYYGPAHFERDCGRALLYLGVNGGAYAEAQQHLEAAVARFPSQQSRGKTLAMANLAHLTMVRDDPSRAVDLGNEALASIGLVRSDRVFEALRQLRLAGKQHRAMPGVRELNQRIDRVLRSTSG
jgi:transcriptional regulator with XRE-family HTH domain/tetratricopeptide (TPR) repeat protein